MLDLDMREEVPQDRQEASAIIPGDEAQDLDDEYSSFEDLHFKKTDQGD